MKNASLPPRDSSSLLADSTFPAPAHLALVVLALVRMILSPSSAPSPKMQRPEVLSPAAASQAVLGFAAPSLHGFALL